MLQYIPTDPFKTIVWLDTEIVGSIIENPSGNFRYFVFGAKIGGGFHTSLDACKESIEKQYESVKPKSIEGFTVGEDYPSLGIVEDVQLSGKLLIIDVKGNGTYILINEGGNWVEDHHIHHQPHHDKLPASEPSENMKVLSALGFKFDRTEHTEPAEYNKGVSEQADFYMNDTHKIIHWVDKNIFTLQELSTTSTHMPMAFEPMMTLYFKKIQEYKSGLTFVQESNIKWIVNHTDGFIGEIRQVLMRDLNHYGYKFYPSFGEDDYTASMDYLECKEILIGRFTHK